MWCNVINPLLTGLLFFLLLLGSEKGGGGGGGGASKSYNNMTWRRDSTLKNVLLEGRSDDVI